ncbi:chemotaxis protein CheB [Blastopirellula marina]|uniref:Chemotaxis protein CheR n=1 Tax=Blastopirellula marina TaxID=124 RepID=A0A2S8F9Q6_9BACT|nr:chemotaxis protein CheB [Blastopirellula marina]PQO28881.1 chemotaxis protein CheR [Blastopirellula marina]PTL42154.1 chemotaxis protein CheR [Blastopirellula marina]
MDRDEVSLETDNTRPSDDSPFYVVGIGASAGGLESLELFFDHMPTKSGMAFVVVQHLSPDFKSLMDQLLARHTQIEIHRVEDGMRVRPNAIYLLQPKHDITIEQGVLRLTKHEREMGVKLPIDVFFKSLASDLGKYAIGVVLSGTGSDGSRGIRDIHANGGLVVIQDSESAGFDGMPRASAATGVADVVCRPQSMPTKILEFIGQPTEFKRGQIEDSHASEEGELQSLFRLFRQRFGIDFAFYKAATIQRRIERRMQLSQTADLSEYLAKLSDNSDELDLLYRDLLVEVTYFFRDAEAFRRLETDVIPQLFTECAEDDEIRVWVSGCATGEEAYSIAMLMHDAADRLKRSANVKIFASDVHQKSMEIASAAIYAPKAMDSTPARFREKYFTQHGDFFHIKPEIRRMVVFARHDLTRDPPFTRINLLSCRNVLIYLEPEIQRRILAMFHFGLRVGGTLMLGPSETIGSLSKEFSTVDQHWRIYRKLRDVRLPESTRMPINPAPTSILQGRTTIGSGSAGTKTEDAWFLPGAYEDLLAKYVPPSLLVNEFYELIHTFGEARKLLVQPPGRTTLDVSRMVEGDLQTAMTAALHRANQKDEAVTFKSVHANTVTGPKRLNVRVEPYLKGSRKLFLICLEEIETTPLAEQSSTNTVEFDQEREGRVEELERELDHTRQSLQTTVEELETSNEELQSTNEELIASNEELQSTNEELHSVNEELYTVNSEYQRKIDELTDLTNDLDNLLGSTDIGTIFLDNDLRIRKFTPSIASAFHVVEHDIGRPIQHISYNLENPDLLTDLKMVLETGVPLEKEVRSRDGRSFLKRVRPYFNESGVSDGLVLTFDEITAVKAAASQAEQAEEDLAISQRELQDFAYAVSHDLQTPLRHIQEFILRLEEEGPILNSSQTHLNGIRNSSSRMQRMINSLLDYSRVNTRGASFELVSLDRVLEAALRNLQEEIKASHASITFEQLPQIQGDFGQLVACLQELIRNAIKFRSDKPLKIHLGARIRNDGWLISVHDNGIGIEQRHYERIFVIFQRLEFKEDTEGMGLGLALCRRILERHHGWIWVESTLGRGSTFFIQLPKGDQKIRHDQQGSAK